MTTATGYNHIIQLTSNFFELINAANEFLSKKSFYVLAVHKSTDVVWNGLYLFKNKVFVYAKVIFFVFYGCCKVVSLI